MRVGAMMSARTNHVRILTLGRVGHMSGDSFRFWEGGSPLTGFGRENYSRPLFYCILKKERGGRFNYQAQRVEVVI